MREIDYNKRGTYETIDTEGAHNLRTALDGLDIDYGYARSRRQSGELLHQFEFDAPEVADAIAMQKLVEN